MADHSTDPPAPASSAFPRGLPYVQSFPTAVSPRPSGLQPRSASDPTFGPDVRYTQGSNIIPPGGVAVSALPRGKFNRDRRPAAVGISPPGSSANLHALGVGVRRQGTSSANLHALGAEGSRPGSSASLYALGAERSSRPGSSTNLSALGAGGSSPSPSPPETYSVNV